MVVALMGSAGSPTAECFTLSLHDALPILCGGRAQADEEVCHFCGAKLRVPGRPAVAPAVDSQSVTGAGLHFDEEPAARSEEHTSELQSLRHLVCRLLLEKKNVRRQGRAEH